MDELYKNDKPMKPKSKNNKRGEKVTEKAYFGIEKKAFKDDFQFTYVEKVEEGADKGGEALAVRLEDRRIVAVRSERQEKVEVVIMESYRKAAVEKERKQEEEDDDEEKKDNFFCFRKKKQIED